MPASGRPHPDVHRLLARAHALGSRARFGDLDG